MHDYYETLQVHPRADGEAIRAAYERLRQRYDPTQLEGAADELVELARRRRDEIERAYTVLSDPERRAAYDRDLAERVPEPAPVAVAVEDDADEEAELDYRPLPPARRQERSQGFNAQPTLPRRQPSRAQGRQAARRQTLPIWVAPTLIVAVATFAIVLITLVTTATNTPPQAAGQGGSNVLAPVEPTALPTPSTEELINRFEGQVVEARQVAEQAPDNVNAWINLGHALYDSTVVVRERLGSGDESLGNVYVERLPRWLEAAEAYGKALELQPGNAVIRADRAASLCYYGADINDQSYVTQGVGEAERALQARPEEPRVLLSMGLCLVSVDPPQTERAIEQWRKLADLPDIDPNLAFQANQLIAQYEQ